MTEKQYNGLDLKFYREMKYFLFKKIEFPRGIRNGTLNSNKTLGIDLTPRSGSRRSLGRSCPLLPLRSGPTNDMLKVSYEENGPIVGL